MPRDPASNFTALRTRIAPTPSGFLHLGNGASFVAAWALARAAGGAVLLRIDDLDRARFRMEYLDDIFFTLDWLGLDYDEGPASPQDFLDRFSQWRRMDLYRQAAGQLKAQSLLYGCDCSRKRIREYAPGGTYPGFCRHKNINLESPGTAWRARLPEQCAVQFREWKQPAPRLLNLAECMGDFIVRQKDETPSYQLASLCDDLHWNINFIVRGTDLLPSTGAQIWLAKHMPGTERFLDAEFFHHPLVSDSSGEKLSKSAGSTSLAGWRKTGRSPQEVYRQAALWLGLRAEAGQSPESLAECIRRGET